jgi:hypothetical protein
LFTTTFGPIKISTTPSLEEDSSIFSADFFQAQYAIPSAFWTTSFQSVGAGGGIHGLTVGVGVGVGEADGVGVGVGSGDGDGEGEGVGVATGDGFLIATPLFQTSFFPDLTQVNFLPASLAVAPALVHLAPALGDAA